MIDINTKVIVNPKFNVGDIVTYKDLELEIDEIRIIISKKSDTAIRIMYTCYQTGKCNDTYAKRMN